MCVCVYSIHIESKDDIGSSLSFHHVDQARDLTQVVQFGGKRLYLLNTFRICGDRI